MSSSTGNNSNDNDQIRNWLSQAAELNEDGVYEMASGRSVQAIQCLENAVQLLMKVWDNASKEEEATNTASSGTPGSVVSSSHNVQVPYLQDEIFYIYPCAMTFSPSLTSAADLTLECTIVLFNLALAYHQHAKKQQQQEANQNNEEELLRQALAYYQECYQVLQSLQHQQEQHTSASSTATTTMTPMQEDWIVMITLAVMNNQAQIMYQLSTNSTTPSSSTTTSNTHPLFQKLWTESLSAILKSNSSSAISNDSSSSTNQEEDGQSCHYHNWSVVEESQLQEFVQNAMVFRLQRPCAAPTA